MIVLVDDRETGLRVGYSATDWSSPISFDEYRTATRGWEIQTITRDTQPIGTVYRKDDEIHVSVVPEWRRKWATRGVLRDLFNRPRVTTRVAAGHDYMYDILRRLGFTRLDDDWMVKEN